MSLCIACKKEVNWEMVAEQFEHILDLVDRSGVESLTEKQQIVYHGQCCSHDCYDHLQ